MPSFNKFLEEEEYDNTLASCNKFVTKIGSESSIDGVIQKGALMRKIDSDMFKRISLGIKRVKMSYQNGAKTLVESYFGENGMKFFQGKIPMKLLRKSTSV